MKRLFLLWLFLVSCTNTDTESVFDYTTIVVEESEVIIDLENRPEMAFPAFVRTAPEYFLIYDGLLQKIFRFNHEGELLFSFGREGRGPGEFLSLTNFWIMEDHYLLYDYNGSKMIRYALVGSFMDEQMVNNGELGMSVEILPDNRIVHPAKGENGSLLKVISLHSSERDYIGEVVVGEDENAEEDVRNLIRQGGVPDFMKNQVSVGANTTGIYAIPYFSAVLQKFSFEGDLLWERDLKISSVEGVFENYLKQNREQEYIYSLYYIRGLHVSADGVAVLLNTTKEKPITVAWIPNDGQDIRVVEFPDIVQPDTPNFLVRFRVAPDRSSIYFVKSTEGEVYRAYWPIEPEDTE